jgi:hypothetical protein
LLDSAFDHAMELGREPGGPSQIGLLASHVGLYLATVIAGTVPGARWRLWPNGHRVLRLPSGRNIDVIAIANRRVSMGSPLLADAYADATAGPLR